MYIVPCPAHPRGVVMGRREDGAAVGTRPEMRPDPTGSMTGEIPPSTDAAPRAWSNALRDPRAMAGLRSQALRPAARSWLTGVAGPRSRKRGPHVARTPPWSAGRRVPPLRNGGTGRSQDVPSGVFRRPPTGGLASPSACRRSAPLTGAGNCSSRRGRTRRRPKNTGDDSRLYARMSAAPWFRNRSVLIKMQIHAHH
jgi:hypothetical protein